MTPDGQVSMPSAHPPSPKLAAAKTAQANNWSPFLAEAMQGSRPPVVSGSGVFQGFPNNRNGSTTATANANAAAVAALSQLQGVSGDSRAVHLQALMAQLANNSAAPLNSTSTTFLNDPTNPLSQLLMSMDRHTSDGGEGHGDHLLSAGNAGNGNLNGGGKRIRQRKNNNHNDNGEEDDDDDDDDEIFDAKNGHHGPSSGAYEEDKDATTDGADTDGAAGRMRGGVGEEMDGDEQNHHHRHNHHRQQNIQNPSSGLGRPITYSGDPVADNLNEDERRRLKRRIANRESARRVRQKRQEQMEDLQQKVTALTHQNARLLAHIATAEHNRQSMQNHVILLRERFAAQVTENSSLLSESLALKKALQGAGINPAEVVKSILHQQQQNRPQNQIVANNTNTNNAFGDETTNNNKKGRTEQQSRGYFGGGC